MKSLIFALALMSGSLSLSSCGQHKAPSQSTALPTVQAEGAWRRFVSTRGGYSIEFPAEARERDLSIDNARAFSADVRVSGTGGKRYFSALSTTYLPGGIDRIGPHAFCDTLFEKVWAKQLEGRLIYKRFWLDGGTPTFEFRYSGKKPVTKSNVSVATTRWLIRKDTVYDLSAIGPPQRITAGDVERFYGSFRFGKAPDSPKYVASPKPR